MESFRKVLPNEPTNVYANRALGIVVTGDKNSAMQQSYILKNFNADLAADLLKAISR